MNFKVVLTHRFSRVAPFDLGKLPLMSGRNSRFAIMVIVQHKVNDPWANLIVCNIFLRNRRGRSPSHFEQNPDQLRLDRTWPSVQRRNRSLRRSPLVCPFSSPSWGCRRKNQPRHETQTPFLASKPMRDVNVLNTAEILADISTHPDDSQRDRITPKKPT